MLENLNVKIFLFMNHYAGMNHYVDKIGILLAKTLPYLFILFLFSYWIWSTKESKNIILYSVYSSIIAISINFLIQLLYFHPRPFTMKLGNCLVKHAPDSSFPSDHTTFLLSISMIFLFDNRRRILGYILTFAAIICGISRIFCGVHFPLDILGALIVAVISSLIIWKLREKFVFINEKIIKISEKIVKSRRSLDD